MTSFAAIGNMDVDAGQFCDRVKTNLLSKGRMILSLLTFLMISLQALPQSSKIYLVKSPNNERIHLGEIPSDSAGSVDMAKRLLSYRNEGHLLADINSILSTEDSLVYEVYLGQKYFFTFIDWDKFPQNFISLAGVRSRRNRYSPRALNKEIGRILTYSGEIGYPFAAVKIDSAEYKDGLLGIQLLLDSGPKITYDSLKIDGIQQTRMSFLQNWLSVHPGGIYQQSRFAMIERRINDLNFLTLKSTPSVAFVNNRARISLELEEERVNTFDGVIGFLQNQGDDRLTITGIVDLELYNLFGTGQELELHWQQQKELSQSLDMGYAHPQLFKSVLGLKLDYNQLKEDTTFINRNFSLGLTLPWRAARVYLYYTRSSGRILAAQVEDRLEPEIADFNVDNYNIRLTFGKFTGRINDRGWLLDMTTSIGDKSILRNPVIDDEFYNSTDLRSTQYRFGTSLKWQIPVGEDFKLYQRLAFNKLINDQLFLNDLYRFGGLNSQRGFNELEFFAEQYALSNLELRWLWNAKSYLFAFYDQSIYDLAINSTRQRDHPLGLGLGLTLSTETGLFRLVYALGQSEDQPMTFNQAKIHFGFTSRF
ncbi:MAG: hypothetical protein RIC80_02680 [Cyclobacteriaceae bacterium]